MDNSVWNETLPARGWISLWEKNAFEAPKWTARGRGPLKRQTHNTCYNRQLEKRQSSFSDGTFSAFKRD